MPKRCPELGCLGNSKHTRQERDFLIHIRVEPLLHSVADRVDLLGNCRRALELNVQLEGFVGLELLPAMWALELAIQLNADVGQTSVA